MPPRFNLEAIDINNQEYYAQLWDYIWAPYESGFDKAIDEEDIDKADTIWSRAAVHFLVEATQDPG